MRSSVGPVIDRGREYKNIIVPSGEALFFSFVLVLSYWIRLGFIEEVFYKQLIFLVVTVVPTKIVLFWLFRLYRISFRYTSLYEIIDVFKASAVSALFFSLVIIVSKDVYFMQDFPRSVIFIDFLLTFLVGSGVRLSFRQYYFPRLEKEGKRNTLVVGAGSACEQLVREMQVSPLSSYNPVAFVDDDPNKHGSLIHGVRVIGGKEGIPALVEGLGIDNIIIAMPSASSTQLKSIMEYVRKSGVRDVKILPGLSRILLGKASLEDIRGIAIEDLLGREPVEIELESIASYLTGKRIMVTGAGGSIGSELCRHIAGFSLSSLIMIDVGETELFHIHREITEKFPTIAPTAITADVKDMFGMKDIFLRYQPQVIFHAAAYKHVPLMEVNPREAVLNNVEGTKTIATLSVESDVERFVFISTDKAVNPTSIMGATKRVAENSLRCWNSEKGRFIAVRFGNVLESRGSVVPLFKEQIQNRSTITITHPEMKRYLMSVTEAVQLVLQAGAIGKGGEVLVLDMGEPVKILDLAQNMIRLSGLEPDKDIPIVFTGKRPGEKLFEELLTAEEGVAVTKHKKIFIASCTHNLGPEYLEKVEHLINVARTDFRKKHIVALLKELVPTYQPDLTATEPDNSSLV